VRVLVGGVILVKVGVKKAGEGIRVKTGVGVFKAVADAFNVAVFTWLESIGETTIPCA
jgi:hypothetical protein